MDLGLGGRACAVTGAGGGLGREAALALCAEGARVLLVDRDELRLREVQEEADGAGRRAGGRAAVLACDPTDADAGERILATATEYFGQLDALVNGAGPASGQGPADRWRDRFEAEVMAPLRAMRAAAPPMAARGWGRIVNVCSAAGRRPTAALAAHSVAAAAELSLSRLFADRYAGRGVLVNAICPDPAAPPAAGGPPAGRRVPDAEIARTVAFLCSEPASYVTGAAWPVGGARVPA